MGEMGSKQVNSRIQHNYPTSQIVQIDVADCPMGPQTKILMELLAINQLSLDKVSNKNRPTFIARREERMAKMDPSVFNQDFSEGFKE